MELDGVGYDGKHEPALLVACPDCGALVPDIDGPTHRYLGASPGCWQAYGELLVREYDGVLGFPSVHYLTVDAYAAQHPGVPGKQSSASVASHLFKLCLLVERNLEPAYASDAMLRFVDEHKGRELPWIEPPPSLGPITVLDVLGAKDADEHQRMVEAVWRAWTPYHSTIRAWADKAG